MANKRSPNSKAAHAPRLYKTSEFIGIVLLISSLTLQRLFPWSLSRSPLWNWIGISLLVAGLVIIRLVHRELNRFSQPHFPGIPTTKLVQSGPFRWSRNPTYAAIVMLIIPGSGLLLRNLWVFALMPPTILAFYLSQIKDEEIYLKRVFGEEWEHYCERTPRWL